ncbi:PH domain-containing protein [Methanorbis rubei]|uniref:YdbS-like PH domain-containing protein n=1 Tax=Methanorbis rubei TaxID=3028300 RepID=A0AAE4MHT1_9EURY|nr:hypothetical protein [Methanocorpusculaceae archaeon Cs1]
MENETTYYVNPEKKEETFELSQKFVLRPVIYLIIGFFALFIIIGILIIPVAMFMLISRTWRYIYTKITISPSVVAITEGYSPRTQEIMIDKIEKVEVNQGIMDKMMNTGTVIISAAGHNITMRKMDDPFVIKDKIVRHIEAGKEH